MSHNSAEQTDTSERSTCIDDSSSDGPSADDQADSFSLLLPHSLHLLPSPTSAQSG